MLTVYNDLHDRLIRLAAEVFQCSASDLSLETKLGDIPEWDSLGHIVLLEAVQETFEIEFPIEQALEVQDLKAVAKLIAS